MYRLVFLSGKHKGKRLTIQQGAFTIGRDPGCNIDLDDDDEVSRHHAVIEHESHGPVIRDLGATNPVLVNQQVVKAHRLRDGDQIEIGRTIMEYQSGKSSQPPRQRRRFSKMQAMSFIAIGVIILIQITFVVLFPLWQKTETIPVIMPEPEPVVVAEIPAPAVPVPVPEVPKVVVPEPVAVPVAQPEPKPDPLPPAIPPPTVATSRVEDIALPGDIRPTPARDLVLDDPLTMQARSMLTDAQAAIASLNFAQADSILERIQLMTPDFIPAWQERAALFEKRKLYRQSGEQWQKVLDLTKGTPAHADATKAHRRVMQLERSTPSVPATKVDVDDRPTALLARNIRILSVDRERFQGTEEFDDMRLIRITLRPRASEGPIDSSQVQVVVNFYDRVEGTDILAPSRALTQLDGTRITGAWPAGESRSVTAAYILRKGFRAEERAAIRERRVYEGYRVSVYYQGVLQDESAMPRRILTLPRPPHPHER